MPELPEVETTRRGIAPHLVGQQIKGCVVRDGRLRWPVDPDLARHVEGATVRGVSRRAKYLLVELDRGNLIIHLGMSGSLRITSDNTPVRTHDHVDFRLANARVLRYHDPRRFGSIHFLRDDPQQHPLLSRLGVEPLEPQFQGGLLHHAARSRKGPVKQLIMDGHVVVGVGNIYASEALFLAGIHPSRPARRISLARYEGLAQAIRTVLSRSIEQGGTTLRDFVNESGEPGYFAHDLSVYGRAGQSCRRCGADVRSRVIAQRNTFFCPACQR
jgi:formamidopyrimidine-DNA glycosylase